MLSSVLNTPVAVQASVQVVRAFVRLREMVFSHKVLARKLLGLERKYDGQFAAVFAAIRKLTMPRKASPEEPPIRVGGFGP